MPIDPNLAFGARPAQNMGPNLGQVVQTANQFVAFQQAQQQQKSQNALRNILGAPGAIDPSSGAPTQNALAQIAGSNPNAWLKLREAQASIQNQQATMLENQTRRQVQLQGLVDPVRAAAMKAYTDTPGSEEVKRAAGEKALNEGLNDLANGGGLSDQEKQRMNRNFDPVRISMMSANWQNYLKQKAATDKAADEGFEVVTDPTKTDASGRPIQYRYNPKTGVALSLTGGQPYTPGGAVKSSGTEFSNPVEVQYPGPDGKPVRVLAQQDKATGGWLTADQTRKPLPAGVTPYKPPLPGAAAENDVDIIAAHRIAEAEKKRGSPLADDEKAAIRQQARLDPKLAEASQKQDVNAISDDAAKLTAEETLKGDWHGTVGMGRNQASMKKIADWRAKIAKEQGITGQELAANTAEFNGLMSAERVLGTRGAGIDLGIVEAQKFAPMVLDLSNKIDRTRFPTVNSLQLAAEKGVGGENVIRLTDALNAYKMAYTQILTRGGMPTDDSRRRSDEVIDKEWSNGQIGVAIDQLGKEMDAAQSAVPAVRDNLYFTLTGKHRPAQEGASAGKGNEEIPTISNDQAGMEAIEKLPNGARFKDASGKFWTKNGAPPPQPQTPTAGASPSPSGSGRTAQDPIRVATPADAMKLPPGSFFLAPDGKVRQRPMAAAPSVPTN